MPTHLCRTSPCPTCIAAIETRTAFFAKLADMVDPAAVVALDAFADKIREAQARADQEVDAEDKRLRDEWEVD